MPSPPRCVRPGCSPAPACHRCRRPGSASRPWLPGAGRVQGRTGGCLPRGLLHGLGNMACHIPSPFVSPMLHYQEGVVVLIQDCPELDGRPRPSSRPGSRGPACSRMPERMPAIKRILNCCRRGLPFRARASISSGVMRTLQGSRGAGRRRRSSI